MVSRGHSWSLMVSLGHSWSLVITRGHSWSLVSTLRLRSFGVIRIRITPIRNAPLDPILKFKAQPTNPFFAAVNQMFDGSSLLPTTVSLSEFNYRATNELIIYAMRQRARADNLTVCWCKNKWTSVFYASVLL